MQLSSGERRVAPVSVFQGSRSERWRRRRRRAAHVIGGGGVTLTTVSTAAKAIVFHDVYMVLDVMEHS